MVAPTQLEALYLAYVPVVRRALLQRGVHPSDLDDLVQETFVTVHRLLPGFEGRSSLSTWLYSVAWRVAANHCRRQRRTLTRSRLIVPAAPEEQELGGATEYARAFQGIAEEERDLVLLHEVGGLTISSMAELTGHARATVRHKLVRGQAALRRAMFSSSRRRGADAAIAVEPALFTANVPIAGAPDVRLLSDGLTCLSTVANTVIAVWRGPCTNEGLAELFATLRAHGRRYPEGVRYLSVVEPDSTPPNREGRAMIARAGRELDSIVKANATLIELSARIELLAGLLNASLYLSRTSIDSRYFGHLEDALRWLAQYGELDEAQIRAQIGRMKQRLSTHRSATVTALP